MAKINAAVEAITRRDVLRSRRRALLRESRGQAIIQAWPRERGPVKSPLQKAWTDRFSCLARALKSPFPQMLDDATGWAKGQDETYAGPKGSTGWYYRDVLERAAYGKLITYQGETAVRTPTANVKRVANQALTVGAFTYLNPDTLIWDNNDFWRSSLNPSRLTMKAPGLYLVGATVARMTTGSGYWAAELWQNRTTLLAGSRLASTSQPQYLAINGVQYFHANDYVEIGVFNQSGTVNYQVVSFWAVAITPEALIP